MRRESVVVFWVWKKRVIIWCDVARVKKLKIKLKEKFCIER